MTSTQFCHSDGLLTCEVSIIEYGRFSLRSLQPAAAILKKLILPSWNVQMLKLLTGVNFLLSDSTLRVTYSLFRTTVQGRHQTLLDQSLLHFGYQKGHVLLRDHYQTAFSHLNLIYP